MQKIFKLLILFSIISCKSTPSLKNIDPPPLKEAIDLIYEKALRYEMKEVGNSIYIVDRAIGKTTFTSDEFDFIDNNTPESYKWNQNIFSKVRYLNKEVIAFQKSKNPKEYFKLIHKLTGGRKMYEFFVPKFTKDHKFAVIEFIFNNSYHYTMIFKWEKNKYQFVKYHTINRPKKLE